MEPQNTIHFGDRFWVAWGAVIRWNDLLALRAREMAAPVGHHAIATVGAITAPAVPDDGG